MSGISINELFLARKVLEKSWCERFWKSPGAKGSRKCPDAKGSGKCPGAKGSGKCPGAKGSGKCPI